MIPPPGFPGKGWKVEKDKLLDAFGIIRHEADTLIKMVMVLSPLRDLRYDLIRPLGEIVDLVFRRESLVYVVNDIRAAAVKFRGMIDKLDALGENRHHFYPRADKIVHECRILHEELTGGLFWYDPVAVRSRKQTGA